MRGCSFGSTTMDVQRIQQPRVSRVHLAYVYGGHSHRVRNVLRSCSSFRAHSPTSPVTFRFSASCLPQLLDTFSAASVRCILIGVFERVRCFRSTVLAASARPQSDFLGYQLDLSRPCRNLSHPLHPRSCSTLYSHLFATKCTCILAKALGLCTW